MMKNFKVAMILTALAALTTMSACSSKKTKTEEVAPVAAATSAPAIETAPSYTMANLGASTAGRAK